ncbi:peroxiredoxin [Thermocatellispora tengchongensis]|uniref:Peroxiredoxin n=1 Tax=Thermocatellispora tengchongensis TaxID=1073253 RepID=A0A840NQN1_9ACTN|nr:peroxiredoxin-like family protein [Thermocatellispora tengchongensis]MBB5130904.1 peroxiredoxin [Thermocatellispora tengchongensis]
MTRYEPGDAVPVRELLTIRSQRIRLPAVSGLTHLQFRRYAGCPICNTHLRSISLSHADLLRAGITEIAVFHSSAEAMRPHQGDLPFAVVADPDRELYRDFGVETSPRAVLHPKALAAPFKATTYAAITRGLRAGGSPAPPRGDTALGLPADFLIDADGIVLAVKYGRHAADQWSVDELLRLSAERV